MKKTFWTLLVTAMLVLALPLNVLAADIEVIVSSTVPEEEISEDNIVGKVEVSVEDNSESSSTDSTDTESDLVLKDINEAGDEGIIKEVAAFSEVSIDCTPEAGYKLENVEVMSTFSPDEPDRTPVDVPTDVQDPNVYTFSMPNFDVFVNIIFSKIIETSPDSVNPDPVNPDPVNPDSVNPDSVNPDPVNPDSVNPDPVNPDPVNLEPVNPAPVNLDPVNPDPVNPDPVNPDPVNLEPVNPAPVNPAPVNPAPVNPAPVNLEPVNPAPVNPAPANPAPVNPEPVNPEPVNPAPEPQSATITPKSVPEPQSATITPKSVSEDGSLAKKHTEEIYAIAVEGNGGKFGIRSVDERTNINQKIRTQYLLGPTANILLTQTIYPRRDLTMAEDGATKTITWSNLPKYQAGPVYAVMCTETGDTYVLNGILDNNGTAVFNSIGFYGFKIKGTSTITICNIR